MSALPVWCASVANLVGQPHTEDFEHGSAQPACERMLALLQGNSLRMLLLRLSRPSYEVHVSIIVHFAPICMNCVGVLP